MARSDRVKKMDGWCTACMISSFRSLVSAPAAVPGRSERCAPRQLSPCASAAAAAAAQAERYATGQAGSAPSFGGCTPLGMAPQTPLPAR
jgi:hypothetical protein